MPEELEIGVVFKVGNVLLRAGEQIVDTEDFVAVRKKAVAQVRAEEAGPARHHDALARIVDGTRHHDSPESDDKAKTPMPCRSAEEQERASAGTHGPQMADSDNKIPAGVSGTCSKLARL